MQKLSIFSSKMIFGFEMKCIIYHNELFQFISISHYYLQVFFKIFKDNKPFISSCNLILSFLYRYWYNFTVILLCNYDQSKVLKFIYHNSKKLSFSTNNQFFNQCNHTFFLSYIHFIKPYDMYRVSPHFIHAIPDW